MDAADVPVPLDTEILLKVEQQIVRGHLAAGEEITGHPVTGAAVEIVISKLAMGKDMDEELAAG